MQTPNSLGRLDTGFPCDVFYWYFLVISTAAGQPPIGKPLIGQARGQLRLTWRLYAESPQSGGISRLNGIGCIAAGDLSTLSFNRITTHHFPYRHVTPLEMTQRQAAYSHSERKRMIPVLPAPLSFRPQQSEVEKSHSSMALAAMTLTTSAPLSFRPQPVSRQ